MDRRKYPVKAEEYQLLEEIGQGVSASVHRALCIPFDEIVAIKILDFERCNSDLSNISREAQTMILIDHPNVLKAHCSFVNDHNLWVVMPFMAGGSCLHILKAAYPDGFEEVDIATILREVLKGLEYLHHHGHIHRDVKAGNALVDAHGGIKLGDFGVTACLFDSGGRQRTRNTFVGTPCWMAPEVMEQLRGYDFKADIWSFGITALELAHGHAPFSKYPPMKVLLMTLQNAPPSLDYERDKKFSKSFKHMIAACLVKDPSKRPSAKKLLKHSFFKHAKSNEYIARRILDGLPPLGERIKALKIKEEVMLAQKKMPDGKKEEISQNEYKRGISDWSFNIEDLKAEAALIQDFEDIIPEKDHGVCSSSLVRLDSLQEGQSQCLPSVSSKDYIEEPGWQVDDDVIKKNPAPSLSDQTANNLICRHDGSESESCIASSTCNPNILKNGFWSPCNGIENGVSETNGLEINGKQINGVGTQSFDETGAPTELHSSVLVPTHLKGESYNQQNHLQSMVTCNGVVASQAVEDTSSETVSKSSKSAASNADGHDEKAKEPVVQQKGRFKVTSENVDLEKAPVLQKSQSLQVRSFQKVVNQLPAISSDAALNLVGSSTFSQLHCILQTNILQRDHILNMMKQVSAGDPSANHTAEGNVQNSKAGTERSLLEAANDREKELLQEITDLQSKLLCAQEELQKLKMRNAQV
ncbi:hypothetical protein AAC387_Pa03g0254 [Persea americana]